MYMLKALLIGLSLVLFASNTLAQPTTVCTVSECKEIDIAIPEFAGAQNLDVNQVWGLASEILAVSGLAPNFQVIQSEDVPNAAAIVRGSERFLVFNAEWLTKLTERASTKWQVYGVLAHEIGHHLQGHTLLGIGSRPPIELEADEYAGFALGALGATLDEAQSLWRGFGEAGSATHPPQHQRLAAIERGWMRAAQRPGSIAQQIEPEDPAPLPIPDRRDERDRSNDAICIPVATSLGQSVVCATSVLPDGPSGSHTPAHLFDDNLETVWTEDGIQFGEGQTIAVEFTPPTEIRRILFHNGLTTERPRIKSLLVKTSSGFEGTITLDDSLDWQFAPLPLGGLDWISFTILEAFPGGPTQDTALAEISFE